jgi:chromosome segregation ATPase
LDDVESSYAKRVSGEHFVKRLSRIPSQLTNMESANASAEALRKQIDVTESELERLKAQLAQVEADAVSQKIDESSARQNDARLVTKQWPLLPEEYKRYGRQMIVPSVGIQGILVLFLYIPSVLMAIVKFW